MSISSFFHSIFGFRTAPTTIFVVILYAAVFISLFVTDQLPNAPGVEKQHEGYGVDLENAYKDLHLIAARPHPYNSYENDRVRAYLLNRVSEIAYDHDHVHVLDDLNSTISFVQSSTLAAYFEGNNILVKVDGYEDGNRDDAILFSAHFDSASTAPGATDDGMSIVALLQMLKYLSAHQPRRTAIFNINNGEESGLSGAHAFLAHPWSELTSTFINFEGAGSGGRPLLFRATSVGILQAFTKSFVTHPHANALTADAFSRGVVRSQTDYAVYTVPLSSSASSVAYSAEEGGMRGADVAFYKHRARYHTPDDSIRGMGQDGARKALWALLEIVRGAGGALLNADADKVGVRTGKVREGDAVEATESAVYFELFANFLVVLSARVLLAIHISLLSGGPIIVAIFAFLLYRQSMLARQDQVRGRWVDELRGYGRFWLALFATIGAQVGLIVGFVKLSPYTIHGHAILTTLSILSLAYLTLTIPLYLAQLVRPVPPAKQKLIILFSLYAFTWAFLVVATVAIERWNVNGVYFVGAWNACTLLGVIIGSVEGLLGSGRAGREVPIEALERQATEQGTGKRSVHFNEGSEASGAQGTGDEGEQSAPHADNVWDGVEHMNTAQRSEGEQEEDEEATERTPLMRRVVYKSALKTDAITDEEVQDRALFWWILEVVFEVPIPVTLLGTILFLWVNSMSQTVLDGGWVGVVYIPLALLCVLLVLPLAPFAHKLHYSFTILVFVVFVASTLYSWLIFPFDTRDARCKVYFSHRVELVNLTSESDSSSYSGVPPVMRTVSALTGVPNYIERIIAELPSSSGADGGSKVTCKSLPVGQGLKTCEWEVDESWAPYPSLNESGPDNAAISIPSSPSTNLHSFSTPYEALSPGPRWISAHVTRLSSNSARFIIEGSNSRNCRIYVDGPKNVSVTGYRVLDSTAKLDLENGFGSSSSSSWHEFDVPRGKDAGVKEVRLWSRTWGRTFVVELSWAVIDNNDHQSESADEDEDQKLEGRLACEWDEYAGGWAGATSVEDGEHGKPEWWERQDGPVIGEGAYIPALEEVLMFLPEWAVATKALSGLVEAVTSFEI